MTRILRLIVFNGIWLAVPLIAQAAASTSDVLAEGVTEATAAAGAYAGNDTGAKGTLLGLLNDTGIFDSYVGDLTWQLDGKSDGSGNGPFTGNPQTTAGRLTFDVPQDGPFVVSIKAANSYSAYLFDGSFLDVDFLSFITDGVSENGNGDPQDLSHASLWVSSDDPAVPEPSAMFVWGGILMALGGVRATVGRRKRNSSIDEDTVVS